MADKKNKKSGFDAPVYGRMVKDDETFVKLPNGSYRLVKKSEVKKKK